MPMLPRSIFDRTARRLVRFAVALAGTLGLVALLSVELHYLLVQHVRCAEHGELVHASGSEAGPGAALHTGHGVRVAPADADGALEDEHHDHCGVVTERAQPARGVIAVLLPLTEPRGATISETVGVRASVDVVLLAPKTSPPV
jgi:hypothetical protein